MDHSLHIWPGVKQSYPPGYIIEMPREPTLNVVTRQEHPSCTLYLEEMLCEFMYSNPEG